LNPLLAIDVKTNLGKHQTYAPTGRLSQKYQPSGIWAPAETIYRRCGGRYRTSWNPTIV